MRAVVLALLVPLVIVSGAIPGHALAVDDAPVVPIPPVDARIGEPLADEAMVSGGESFADPQAEADAPATSTSGSPAGAAPEAEDVAELTVPQLRALEARLTSQRDVAKGRLVRLEIVRATADQRLDDAVAAWSRQLVAAYGGGGGARLQALVSVRGSTSAQERATLAAALEPSDRAIVVEHDAAASAVDGAGVAAEAARAEVVVLEARLADVSATLDDEAPATGAELARDRGDRYAVDSDLIFATGPIPGIGYWGAVSGGGMLSGWMGYAGAAVGGVGCTPPDPVLQGTGSIELGDASWYGPGFDGRATATGETYDQTAMTAAHRTLPFGTVVRVQSSTTSRCAFVRINDRGPFVDGRIIDLSRAAADAIGLDGVAPVQVEVWAAPGVPVPTTTAPLSVAPVAPVAPVA